ncbi:MAG: PorP/SprF family type IX secretion system membrane protein [Flavobacteriales bacterium]|nr:PorP/SprF family type IX secretion system membrane protein [Flavobacteriales bacterium]
MKQVFIYILIHLLTFGVNAQQELQSSFNTINPQINNPGALGRVESIYGTLSHRSQWLGVEGNPNSTALNFGMPLGFVTDNAFAGTTITQDQLGSFSRLGAYVLLAYSLKITSDIKIAIGLNAGGDFTSANFSELLVKDQNDPIYLQNIRFKFRENAGLGLYYQGNSHFLGFSIPRIIENNVEEIAQFNVNQLTRHYYISGGYGFDLNSNLRLTATMNHKITANTPISMEYNLFTALKETFIFGAIYRHGDIAGLNFNLLLDNGMSIGYAYDHSIGFNSSLSSSHEILIGYDLYMPAVNLNSRRPAAKTKTKSRKMHQKRIKRHKPKRK